MTDRIILAAAAHAASGGLRLDARVRSNRRRARRIARRWRTLTSPLLFARGFIDNWRQVGSVVPSSPWLVDAMLDPIDWKAARVVVELGPGTGVVTREILRRMDRDTLLIAVEANADFADYLRATIHDPRLRLVTGDASQMQHHLAVSGARAADAIISSLPLRNMTSADRGHCLDAAAACLSQTGRFVAYQYSRRLFGDMTRHFASVWTGKVWRNLPPAYVFIGGGASAAD